MNCWITFRILFPKCTLECASTTSLPCSLIHLFSQPLRPSLSLFLYPTVALSLHPTVRRAVSQCVMSLFCHSIRGECQPWPVARIGMAHICLFDIVAHSCSARSVYFYTVLLVYFSSSYQNVKWISMYFYHLVPHNNTTHIYHAVIILERSLELKTRKHICFDLSIIDDLIIHRVPQYEYSFLSIVRPFGLCLTRKPISWPT